MNHYSRKIRPSRIRNQAIVIDTGPLLNLISIVHYKNNRQTNHRNIQEFKGWLGNLFQESAGIGFDKYEIIAENLLTLFRQNNTIVTAHVIVEIVRILKNNRKSYLSRLWIDTNEIIHFMMNCELHVSLKDADYKIGNMGFDLGLTDFTLLKIAKERNGYLYTNDGDLKSKARGNQVKIFDDVLYSLLYSDNPK